ncbi:hypothetical protein G4D61_13620 [Bacillus ginsengihumi]|uniref:Uncharacterized protein n=1 Tax=Heyndrickxia ginsengihumi TaxID=363870 RepID=A0A6M0PAS1_9BACI|nr:hypothetical protein [Heyndrickxia ginsengihumi]MBE6185033.1 hypothetical protein [Bacillus sp. (in: firmicutes)]NEY20990.1 hypothetical protein [Heyndrickxia ginsengihumi]
MIGCLRTYDAGYYQLKNGETGYFMNNLGAGFDAYIARQINQSKLKKWCNRLYVGKLAYVMMLIIGLFQYRPSLVEVEVDGHKERFEQHGLLPFPISLFLEEG